MAYKILTKSNIFPNVITNLICSFIGISKKNVYNLRRDVFLEYHYFGHRYRLDRVERFIQDKKLTNIYIKHHIRIFKHDMYENNYWISLRRRAEFYIFKKKKIEIAKKYENIFLACKLKICHYYTESSF